MGWLSDYSHAKSIDIEDDMIGRGHRGRTDQNHSEIKRLFEAHGLHTHSTATLGNGFPDMIIGWRDRVALIEVKHGKKALTEAEITFHAIWPVFVCRDEQDVTEIVRWMKGSIP